MFSLSKSGALALVASFAPLANGMAIDTIGTLSIDRLPPSNLTFFAEDGFARRAVPEEILACATPLDLKFQPAMDFDQDSCYNSVAIGPDGALNPGMDHCESCDQCGCRDVWDLDAYNNVYSRTRCNNNGWCAHMYGYYFEKDKALPLCISGHRHDWEHVVVWTENEVVRYVGASAHGGYEVKDAKDVRFHQGTHPKIVYHKDGLLTHAMRFATEKDDNPVENHYGEWFYGRLISFNGFPSVEIRDKMLYANWGSANVGFNDNNFQDRLNKAKGNRNFAFDTGRDEGPNSPGQPSC